LAAGKSNSNLLLPTWADLQFALVVIMLIAANLSIAVSQIALGMALLVQLVRRFSRGGSLPATGLGRWVLALAGWALLMIPFSTAPGQSLVFFKRFFLFAALWVVGSVATDTRRQWILLGAVLLGAVAISLFGQIHVWRQTGSLFRLRLGEMSNPMTSGCLLMMSLLLVGGFLLARGFSGRLRIGLGLAALPVVLGLIQTMTRSAWLGLVAGLGTMLLMRRPRLFGVFAGLLVLFLVVVPRLPEDVVGKGLKRRLSVSYMVQGNSTNQRFYMWNEGWAMVRRHPVTGVGDRDLTEIGPSYYQHEGMNYYGHLHSNPVMLAAIWGIPGFLLGTGFLLRQLWLVMDRWRGWARHSSGPAAAWILAAAGVWAGFFVAGLTEWYFGDAESMLLYLALTGVAVSVSPPAQTAGEDHA